MRSAFLVVATVAVALGEAAGEEPRELIDEAIRSHAGLTGSLVLERGEQALLARAWLVDHARESIEVQYFIWSTDNIGILASEALLRAAQRGVAVRVLVDDLLIDAPDETLLALAAHPRIDIRIYNPVHSVGVAWYSRLWSAVTDFRGSNQRMHDKVLIVDGELAITGGRNMADEYFDYDHAYNFRDRDALVMGAVVQPMHDSFERFWASDLAVPVERLLDGDRDAPDAADADVEATYRELAAYAADTANFAPEVRAALAAVPDDFSRLAANLAWGRVDFVSDLPGKNSGAEGLSGGGLSSAALAALLTTAQSEVVIQSPYLVASEPAFALFRELNARGVRIRISTNSLASTDNLKAFSGYLDQREELLEAGVEVFEYRPDPRDSGIDHGPLCGAARRGARVRGAREESRRRRPSRFCRHLQPRSALGEPEHRDWRGDSRRGAGRGRGRRHRHGHAPRQQLECSGRRPGPLRFDRRSASARGCGPGCRSTRCCRRAGARAPAYRSRASRGARAGSADRHTARSFRETPSRPTGRRGSPCSRRAACES